MQPEISVIIPVHNEELVLDAAYTRITASIKKISSNYELLFVNDGSKDKSIELIKRFASIDNNVKYIDLSRNFGHQIALSAGIDAALGNSVVIIDADLQDPPELIAELYNKLNEGFDVVYAKRRERKGERFLKKLVAKYFYRVFSKIIPFEIPIDTGDFRILNKRIVEQLRQMPEQQRFLRAQIAWLGFNQSFVEFDREPRYAGKGTYTYKKLWAMAVDGITAFSSTPLKIASNIGLCLLTISVVLLGYLFFNWLETNQHPSSALLLLFAILFIGSIQLICLGIIGEYISRINTNVRNRPLYVVKQRN
ncbi:MAG: glycosyltransferase family 2 protein [Bacteroidetes bacterium]|nr:glycosyltransferase family 2 protein [Bacteroidota bacterium]